MKLLTRKTMEIALRIRRFQQQVRCKMFEKRIQLTQNNKLFESAPETEGSAKGRRENRLLYTRRYGLQDQGQSHKQPFFSESVRSD